MPSIKTSTPILGGRYYHIFNRGINRQAISFSQANYFYFLNLLQKYLSGYIEVLAYCLLENHFHMVVKVKDDLPQKTGSVYRQNIQTRSLILLNEEEVGKMVSKQFRRFFSSYAMAINKQEKRVSNLFDPKFKRIEITEHEYLEYAIFYTHFNPQKHGYSDNFKLYKYSSYKALCSSRTTHLNRKLVWDLYGGKDDFIEYHHSLNAEKQEIIME